jgi:hypothetical protein
MSMEDDDTSIEPFLVRLMNEHDATAGLGIKLGQNADRGSSMEICCYLPSAQDCLQETYPAIFVNMEARAVSYALDLLRRHLMKM